MFIAKSSIWGGNNCAMGAQHAQYGSIRILESAQVCPKRVMVVKLVPRPAPRSPRGAKRGPKRAQEDLQMDQRRLHGTPRELKEVQRSEGGGPGASKIGKVRFSKSIKNQ